MTPVYFPFTYATRPMVEVMRTCFKKIVVYQPLNKELPRDLKDLDQAEEIELNMPVPGDEDRIVSIMKDYQNWVADHGMGQGIHSDYLKTRQETVPFFDPTSSSNIKSEIKQRMGRGAQDVDDSLLGSKLFLSLAQNFDIKEFEGQSDLRSLEMVEQELFKKVRGESSKRAAFCKNMGQNTPDSRDYMIPERIMAWMQLFQRDCLERNMDVNHLLITSSPAVFDHIIRKSPDSKEVFIMENRELDTANHGAIDLFREELSKYLHDLIHDTKISDRFNTMPPMAEESAGPAISLRLNVMENTSPFEWLGDVFEENIKRLGENMNNGAGRNTVIGFLGFSQSQ